MPDQVYRRVCAESVYTLEQEWGITTTVREHIAERVSLHLHAGEGSDDEMSDEEGDKDWRKKWRQLKQSSKEKWREIVTRTG